MKIVTVMQARRGSTRLPDKVMKPILGRPVFLRQIERMQRAAFCGDIVVATTTEPEDDAIAELCAREQLNFYRGHTTDLLNRHYEAAKALGADVVVKIPSDCPLIDPAIIDRVIGFYIEHVADFDFVSNLHPATYPDGNDVEVFPMFLLELANREAEKNFEREHTTPFFWENPERFRIGNVTWETGKNYSMSHRWTLDYPEDFHFIKIVYEKLYPHKPDFTLEDILTLLRLRSGIRTINEKYLGSNWYRYHLHELKTISSDQTRSL
ncbi:glycosyltransferase family protein [bacterium]|nr:glycosyltransferase family protein [bacterium]